MSAERPFLKQSFSGIVKAILADLSSGGGGRVVLDDGTEGSVLRTLVEAFSRELAVCYEQLEAVCQAGYLDTASGAALERVVELLGIKRHEAGWLEGDVVFSRATPVAYDIEIPAGTLIAGKRVQAFETIAPDELRAGESSVRVPVRSLVPKGSPVDPGKLSLIKRPIPGIETVTNPGMLLPRRDPESDDELRSRARHAIRGGRTATVSAIERAVLALGIVEVSVFEDLERPGRVNVVLGDLDLTRAEIDQAAAAVEEVRPAGVRVSTFAAKPVWIRVRATVLLDDELEAAAEIALRSELETAMRGYFADLTSNETVRWSKLRNLLTANPLVAEVSTPAGPEGSRWSLDAIHPDTGEVVEAETRRLGTEDAPVGVFIGADERATLAAVELDLQQPRAPVWIDVEVKLVEDPDPSRRARLEGALRDAISGVFPSDALTNPVSATWNELRDGIRSRLEEVGAFDLNSIRFVILHDRDGRVVTVADDPAASEVGGFTIREQIELRAIRLIGASER